MKKELIQSLLEQAMLQRQLMRFSRRFEKANIRGYVVDLGPRFFMIALVSDRIWFDGFECFRQRDVLEIEPEPHAAFAQEALKKRGQSLPTKPTIDLAGIEAILRSANHAFPLVTIHREESDPENCHIGHVLAIGNGRVSLLEIDPNAHWDTEPIEYRLNDITRVSFGGDYEDALFQVGGVPTSGLERS